MDHGKLIRDLGGAAKVADALRERGISVEDVTVRSWTLAGRKIPGGYWVHIVAIAASLGVPCSLEALARSVAIPGHDRPLLPVPEDDRAEWPLAETGKTGEISGGLPEADSPRPFAPLSPTCSPTSAPPPPSPASAACSTAGEA